LFHATHYVEANDARFRERVLTATLMTRLAHDRRAGAATWLRIAGTEFRFGQTTYLSARWLDATLPVVADILSRLSNGGNGSGALPRSPDT
jgi:hypothetical protein